MAEGTLPPAPDAEPNFNSTSPDPFEPDNEDQAAAERAALHAPAEPAPVRPKRKRRRRWPVVMLVMLLLVVLLAALLPTLLSTAPARTFVVGKINQNLNGKVQVADWSMGWRSPITVSGVKVFDRAGAQILELPRLTTELTLLDAVRGRLHVGKVTAEGLNVLVRRDPQGNVNLAELMKPGAGVADLGANPQPTPDAADAGGTKLPDLRGELHLVNCRATYEDQLQGQTFYFPSIAGQVKFPDINQSVENALDVACKVGDGPTGRLTVAGKADVVENFQLAVDQADVDEKLTVQGVDLGSLSFLFGKDSAIQKLAGMTDGVLTVRSRPGEGITSEGQITSSRFALGGPALQGDTFATQKLVLTLPPTTLNTGDSEDWKAWSLRVGTGGTDTIQLAIDQGRVQLASDAKLQSLLNLAENKAPGAAGRVRADVDLDVGALARQMPKTFALQEGLTLESARLTHATDVELAPDRAAIRRLETHLTDVRGRNERGPVSLQPIDLSFTAATFGGGWKAPDVRDLSLTLRSGFANAQFTGKDVSQIAGSASGDLKRLRDELGQVVDFGTLQLAGPFTVRVDSKGDVVGGGPSTVRAEVNVTDLLVEGLAAKPPIRQQRVLLTAAAEVVRAADGSVQALRGGNVAVNTGDERQPTVDAVLTGAVRFHKPAPTPTAVPTAPTTAPATAVASSDVRIDRLNVDLPRARADFAAFVPALNDYAIQSGTLSVGGSGHYDGKAVTSDARVVVKNLTVRQAAESQAELLRDETITVALQAQAPGNFTSLTLASADVTGSILTANVRNAVMQLDAATLDMVRSADVTADVPDLAKLQAFADAFSTAETAPPPAAPAPPAAAPARPTNVRGSDVIGRRPVPAAPAPRAVARDEADAPPPLRYAGSANVKLNVARQGGRTVITPNVTGRNVTLSRGAASENLGDVQLATAISFVPAAPAPIPAPATAPAISDQVRDLQVPQLTATFAGSELTLAEPLVVSDVAGLGRLFASFTAPRDNAGAPPAAVKTAVRGRGDIGRVLALVKVLQGTGATEGDSTYAGTYALEQRLTGGGDGLAMSGTLNVDDFAVVNVAPAPRGAAGRAAPAGGFAEKAIRLANDVRLDAGRQVLSVRNVALDMETTKALELKLAGNVLDFNTQRRLENVQGTLGYDWAKLWEMVRPMLSKEQQENIKLRVAGQAQRTFALGGSLPAAAPDGRPLAFHEAVRSLTGHLEGGFDVVEVNGLTIEKLELPLTLKDGMLSVAYYDRLAADGQNLPAAASCNGGKLNLGGATVDLADAVPRLNLPKGHKLLEGATLNPIFSDMFGHLINNPLFVNPSEARGLVDVTVVQCERLPLDALVLKNAPENDGRAEIVFSIREVFLGNSILLEGLKLAGQADFARSLQGEIRDSRVIIERGRTTQDVVFNLGENERPLRIAGTTALETSRLNLTMTIPPQLLRQLGQVGREVLKVRPEGLPLEVRGTTSSIQVDLPGSLAKFARESLIGGAIDNAINDLLRPGGRDRRTGGPTNPPTRQPADQPAERAGDRATEPGRAREPAPREPAPPPAERDPLKDLIDLVDKNRQEQERQKQERREERRRQREQDQGQGQDGPPARGSDRIGRDPSGGQ